MKINWFPGHMTKSLRMISQEIANIDIVLYVLDSRAPISSMNPKLDQIIKNKPVIYILNKSDLSDDKANVKWKLFFEQEKNSKAIIINSTISNSSKQIIEEIKNVLADKILRDKNRGIKKPLKAMVIGIPNSGKSTLINNLSMKKKTITGDKPGVTRGKQWVRISEGIELLDTPGTLYPNLENQEIAKKLAFIGSIKDQVYDIEELTLYLLEDLSKKNISAIEKRYGIDLDDLTPIEMYEKICKRMGFIIKGGDIDYQRGAQSVLDDFRKGTLGRFTLDD